MTKGSGYSRAEELRSLYRRVWRVAILVSLSLHLLVLILSGRRVAPELSMGAAGPDNRDDRAAAAGGGLQLLDLRIVEARPEISVPVPAPVPEVEVEVVTEPEVAQVEVPELAAVEPGVGGVEVGVGDSVGGDSSTGRGGGGTEPGGDSRLIPPTLRGLILPPSDRPRKVRGREVTVWVFVAESGQVVPDSTRVLPSTGDSKFDERLRSQAAEWVFQPARRGGRALAEWFRVSISL